MKKFLTPFAALAAGFAAQNASATPVLVDQPKTTEASHAAQAVSERLTIKNTSGDEFNFVLKRSADNGMLMAYHHSHASHSSHSSHHSHYSGR